MTIATVKPLPPKPLCTGNPNAFATAYGVHPPAYVAIGCSVGSGPTAPTGAAVDAEDIGEGDGDGVACEPGDGVGVACEPGGGVTPGDVLTIGFDDGSDALGASRVFPPPPPHATSNAAHANTARRKEVEHRNRTIVNVPF